MERAEAYRLHIEWAPRQPGMYGKAEVCHRREAADLTDPIKGAVRSEGCIASRAPPEVCYQRATALSRTNQTRPDNRCGTSK
jgi:hypothetical protein